MSSPAYSQEAIKTSDCTIWIYTWMGDICSIYDEWIMSGSEHDTDIWLIIPISTFRDYLPGSERHFEHKKTKEPETSVCSRYELTVESFHCQKKQPYIVYICTKMQCKLNCLHWLVVFFYCIAATNCFSLICYSIFTSNRCLPQYTSVFKQLKCKSRGKHTIN